MHASIILHSCLSIAEAAERGLEEFMPKAKLALREVPLQLQQQKP